MSDPAAAYCVGYDGAGTIRVRLVCPPGDLEANQAKTTGLTWLAFDPATETADWRTRRVQSGAFVAIS